MKYKSKKNSYSKVKSGIMVSRNLKKSKFYFLHLHLILFLIVINYKSNQNHSKFGQIQSKWIMMNSPINYMIFYDDNFQVIRHNNVCMINILAKTFHD